MSNYNISSNLDNNKVFILRKRDLENRLDPNTYHPERRRIIEALKASGHKLEPLKSIATFNKNVINKIPENLPYVGLENIESNTGSYIPTSEKSSISSAMFFDKGNVLFPKLRPYLNKVFFANFKGVCSTEFHILNSTKVSNEYLANYLRTSIIVNQTKYLMSGNTLPRLQTEDIEKLLIPILSDEMEMRVNKIMQLVFNQKQQNELQAEKLLASIDNYLLKKLGIFLPNTPENTLKNRIFKTTLKEISGCRFDPSWFLYLKRNSKSIYPERPLKFLLSEKPQYGANEIGIERTNINQPRYIRITDINEVGELSNELGKTADNIESKYYLDNNDLLLARSGNTVGKSYLHKNLPYSCFFAGYMIRFKINSTLVLPDYVFSFTLSSIYKLWTKAIQRSTGQPNINSEEYMNLLIPIPPLQKQREISDHINAIRREIQTLKNKSKEELAKANKEIEKILLN